jgi:hypothetical protein
MGFIDFIVNRSFRDEPQGRVVVFSGLVRGQGYLVRSASDEHRIRAFIKVYVFAVLALQMLGALLVSAWASLFLGAGGTPTLERELTRAGFFFVAYAVVVGVPFFFLLRVYRQAVPSFVSLGDAVTLSRPLLGRAQLVALALIAVLLIAVALTMVVLVSAHG